MLNRPFFEVCKTSFCVPGEWSSNQTMLTWLNVPVKDQGGWLLIKDVLGKSNLYKNSQKEARQVTNGLCQ